MSGYRDDGCGGSPWNSPEWSAAIDRENESYKECQKGQSEGAKKPKDAYAEQYNKLHGYLTKCANLEPNSSQYYDCATSYGFIHDNSKNLVAIRHFNDVLILLDAYYKQANQQSTAYIFRKYISIEKFKI